ncbi:MAG: response regulator transcription factor [Candidatus Nanopelagicales bacterium]|nr:response regulator transcription factor [Candidatus Nanopelagicales bacterium]
MLVLDSEPVFAAGAVGILGAAGFEAVSPDGSTGEGSEVSWVAAVLAVRPSAVVIDAGLGMRPYGGDLAAELSARAPAVAVVVLVRRARSVGIVDAIECGALALVHRGCAPEELVAAVSSAIGGQNWVAAPLAGILREELLSEVSGERPPELSRRELEVLRGLATGATNAQIGRQMAISENTVRNHVHAVMRKLNVANRTDAVATGLRRGLVDLHE